MKKIGWLVIFVAMTGFVASEKKPIRIFLAGDSTMSIKEKKAWPETGWGMPFETFWDTTVTVINKARNGRSTKTFISEGLWQSILSEAREGDYVFIQFGHNDESKEKAERYTDPVEFKKNLKKFIDESRGKKSIPILLTPVSRRKFDKQGNSLPTHEIYSELVLQVSMEEKVPLIDLDRKSRELYQSMGEEDSKLLFLQLKPGEHPNYPEGKNDNTHFNELGARLIAQLVLSSVLELNLDLKERIVIPPKK